MKLGIADEVVPEPLGGAHQNPEETAENLGDAFEKHLKDLDALTIEERIEDRYRKFRSIGVFKEENAEAAG